jgi:hypothetical protein
MLGIVSVYVCVLAWVENKFLELLSEQCGWHRKLLLQIQEGEKKHAARTTDSGTLFLFADSVRPFVPVLGASSGNSVLDTSWIGR